MGAEERKIETRTLQRTGCAEWSGALRGGQGRVSTESGALRDAAFSFPARFEEEPGPFRSGNTGAATTPEELLGAAHAACFSMTLVSELTGMGQVPDHIRTEARVTLAHEPGGWVLSRVDLAARVRLPRPDAALLRRAATRARANCPVSRLFDTEITVEAEAEETA